MCKLIFATLVGDRVVWAGFFGVTVSLTAAKECVGIAVALASLVYIVTQTYFLIRNRGKK